MAKIDNIKDLRDHALATLKKLEEKEIEIQEAAANATLYGSVISTIKTEMDYFKMLGQKPNIAFLAGPDVYEGEIERPKLGRRKSEDDE